MTPAEAAREATAKAVRDDVSTALYATLYAHRAPMAPCKAKLWTWGVL